MKKKKIFFALCISAGILLFSACGKKTEEKVESVGNLTPVLTQGLEMTDDERLEKLCEKAKQLYTVEPVETEGNTKILVYELIPSVDARIRSSKGELVAQYELPCKLSTTDAYNFYYDGEIFAVAEGTWNPEQPEIHNNKLSIWVSWNGGEFERLEVGETERAYQTVYFGFGEDGRIALITEIDMRTHEVFLREDSRSEWKKFGTAESFGACYGRPVSCISFFDGTTGVVATPLIDPAYTNFVRTEDAGENWEFASKELLEIESGAEKEYGYSVLRLHCEGALGAALVRVSYMEEDGSDAFYLYTTTDKGQNWKVEARVK